MAERKRRGLGRGLGALINSDGEDQSASGATAHAVAPVEPEIPAEPVSRETQEAAADRPERPIDVFFSAKSHLETQKVSRETDAPRNRTTVSRANGRKRAEMPAMPSTSPGRAGSMSDTPPVSRETESPAGAEFLEVPVQYIQPNPRQPRQVFDEEDMAELVHSVREIGVLQPIVVRPLDGGMYELIMGERRWRASQAAARETIPAIVRHTADENLLRDALLENIHRSELNPLEEAAAYQQLLDDFGISQEELSRRIGRSRPQISNTLRLMRLPAAAQRRVAAGVLSSGHARALLSLETEEEMEELAGRVVAEGLSVRASEEQASLMKKRSEQAHEPVSRETDRLPQSSRYEQLDEYAEALTDQLDTQVKITLGARKGRIAIDFAGVEDLERVLQQLGLHVQS
ncbi:ParB/RepB/Spo0J family partition protein [Nesterenkonia populi]|uniref:ParB/RepB/Spo0J family partition protein n=1 Tax=Nesterenkonia populi TaxID=1591087 RepID=UPI0011BFDFCC|nr:ParB/RepB/Spo0J family partition protein [Nesterenkonia populi]